MSQITVLAVPFKENILEIACEQLISTELPFQDVAVILPSQRNKLYFSSFLFQKAKKSAIILPHLYEISEFLQEATLSPYPGPILNAWQRSLFLKEAIFQAQTDEAFASLFPNIHQYQDFFAFLEVGKRLLKFYNEILRERISFETLRGQTLYTDYEKHIAILERIFEVYQKILKAGGLVDPVIKEVGLKLDMKFLSLFKALFLVGPVTMTQTECLFFKKVSEHLPVIVLMQANEKEGLFPLQQNILKAWNYPPSQVKWLNANSATSEPFLEIKAFDNPISQMALVLKGIEEGLASGIRPEEMAIVLPDVSFKYLLLSHLDENGLNLTMGLDLRHSLSFSWLYGIYQILSSETEYGYYYKHLLSLLTHPLAKRLWPEEAKRLYQTILQENLLYVPISYPSPIINTINQLKDDWLQSSLGHLCQVISSHLKSLKDNALLKPLMTHYHEILALNRMLEELQELKTIEQFGILKEEPLTCLQFLINHLSSLTYPLPGQIEGRIQAMEVLETRNLNFKVVIIPDLNEGIFPQKSEKDMFLNTFIRRVLKLPTYQEREWLQEYYFKRLLQASQRAYLSYVHSEKREIRSRFLEPLIFRLTKGDIEAEEQLLKPFPYPYFPTGYRPLIKTSKKKLILPDTFSPSSLLCYQTCPYKFFLKYVLGLKPPPQVSEYLQTQDIGNVFHSVLKEFYKNQLFQNDEASFINELTKALKTAFEAQPQFKAQPALRLEIELLLEKVPLFVRQEQQFFQEGWRPQVSLLEREMQLDFALKNGTKVCLKGIPDRIDFKDKAFRILDYKTGRIPQVRECYIGEEFKGIQLPFYLFLFHKLYNYPYDQCEELGFYDLKEMVVKNQYRNSFFKDPLGYMRQFEDWLQDTLSRIILEQNWQRKVSDACRYCDYQDMCLKEII